MKSRPKFIKGGLYMYIYFDARIEHASETAFTDPIKLLRFKFSSTLGIEKLSVRIYRNTIRIHDVEQKRFILKSWITMQENQGLCTWNVS